MERSLVTQSMTAWLLIVEASESIHIDANCRVQQVNLRAMASNLEAMASNLEAMASNIIAMASNLTQ